MSESDDTTAPQVSASAARSDRSLAAPSAIGPDSPSTRSGPNRLIRTRALYGADPSPSPAARRTGPGLDRAVFSFVRRTHRRAATRAEGGAMPRYLVERSFADGLEIP